MLPEGLPEADLSILRHEKLVCPRLLEPGGTSKEAQCQEHSSCEASPPSSATKEVSTLAKTEGKAQEAPRQGVQEEGTLATRRKGVKQGGETRTELKQAGGLRKELQKDPAGKGRSCKEAPATRIPWAGRGTARGPWGFTRTSGRTGRRRICRVAAVSD